MKTFSVKLYPLGKEFRVREGTPLPDVLHEYGVEFPCGGKGSCGRCKVRLLAGEIETNSFHRERLKSLRLDDSWRLACLSRCHENIILEVGQFETVIQADETSFDFIPGFGLGVAFDLGTTTLVAQLLDLKTGKILAVETALNPQRKYGSDLISRLEASINFGSSELLSLIRRRAGEMTAKLMRGRKEQLNRMVIVGNTVMHHIFCGFDPKPLAFYPFESPEMVMGTFTSEELGWNKVPCDRIEFYPPIASFVGSDVLAGILATGMHRKESMSVLVDLGTNGEIVAGNRHRLLCASTAAGPAFEGAKISQGMQATTGAISSITNGNGSWKCNVIGNARSKGICGSGLIDAVFVLMRNNLIGQFGEILSGDQEIALDSRVRLTQRDIQEFQLAKAAIAAGIDILLGKLGISRNEVDDIYIAGGFGNYINLDHMTGIGMLRFPVERIHKLGNTALMGSKMFLFESCKDPRNILGITGHVNLEAEPDFQDIYVNHLALGGPES